MKIIINFLKLFLPDEEGSVVTHVDRILRGKDLLADDDSILQRKITIQCHNIILYAIGIIYHNIPADIVSVDEVIVLLVLLPYTAVTLTVQLLPALREAMV